MTLLRMSTVDMVFPDGTAALDGVSLTLSAGEFVAVVGPSGCGKSTLLRVAAGLQRPTGGTVERPNTAGPDGTPAELGADSGRPAELGADSGRPAELGYVFQDPTLLPWRSVRRNVELAAELRGVPRPVRRSRPQYALERVDLADFADHRPAALSGGMRMRASLARALTLEPELLLLDEPFGSLDEITRGRIGDDLQRLYAADGFAALLVTHSVAEAVYLAQRVLVMSARPGRIIDDIEVPLSYPREPVMRYEPGFAVLAGRVSAALERGMDRAGGAAR